MRSILNYIMHQKKIKIYLNKNLFQINLQIIFISFQQKFIQLNKY